VVASLHPFPGPPRRRGVATLIVAGALMLLAFGGVATMFNREGGLRLSEEPTGQDLTSDAPAATGSLSVVVEPSTLDPLVPRVMVAARVTGEGPLVDDSGALRQPVRIIVTTLDETTSSVLRAGAPPGGVTFPLALSGEVAAYPFDHYLGLFLITAHVEPPANAITTADAPPQPLPVSVSAAGGLYGWTTIADLPGGPTTEQPGRWDPAGVASLSFERTFSTRAFALLLLLAIGTLAAASLYSAILIATYRRPLEVLLLAWTSSIVFALPVLRNALPAGPPIGAAIDVFFFFWALLAAMLAVVLCAWVWSRVRRDELLAAGRTRPPGSA